MSSENFNREEKFNRYNGRDERNSRYADKTGRYNDRGDSQFRNNNNARNFSDSGRMNSYRSFDGNRYNDSRLIDGRFRDNRINNNFFQRRYNGIRRYNDRRDTFYSKKRAYHHGYESRQQNSFGNRKNYKKSKEQLDRELSAYMASK
ncbi:hypothetical protein NAPIS_ORF00192 [Vairimorpha apis BRL 01]|uniref:Uncharacterized protein n=1 Tax=Vairimorpha apis BRL 01 TaxID=1037528 RepID=T0MMJ4_9MICR|nr:hypothetical protein NAPIS_ORF00192 [Vairimorpha apis BRL 01]